MPGIAAVEGTGSRRVLVLHGWASDSTTWSVARRSVDRRRFTYAYVDFPGYGVDRPAAPADGVDAMAAAALAAADDLGWHDFGILGHGMGGGTAIRAAHLAPERVVGVVALAPVGPRGMPLPARSYEVLRATWADPGPVLGTLAPNLTRDHLDALVAATRASLDQHVWETYLANWTGFDFADAVGGYSGPITIAYGVRDPLITAGYLAHTMIDLRGFTLLPIEGAGHYPMVERAPATVRLWEDALGDTTGWDPADGDAVEGDAVEPTRHRTKGRYRWEQRRPHPRSTPTSPRRLRPLRTRRRQPW
jgi:pimeloyl-ACP methyl ester carboxylesterase